MKIFNSIVKYSRILQEVDLSGNTLIGNEGVEIISKNLGRNKSIQIFKLSSIQLSDYACKCLQGLLLSNTDMKSLDISSNHITTDGMKLIL